MSKFGIPLLSLALGAIGATFASVTLQASTPGSAESGHINVTGTIIGGKVMAGTTSGTANVNGVTTAASGVGGYFETSSGTGYGGWFRNLAPTSSSAIALKADNLSAVSGATAGYFKATSTATIGTNGVFGQSAGTSTSATGVFGYSDYGNGVFGQSSTPGGRGVSGYSTDGIGSVGQTASAGNYGVKGIAPTGGAGHAVYAQGTMAASGTKSLMIDHPDDPENKYLLQSCAEGDTPQLQYRGSVKLDSTGSATVQLPHYFDKINRDPICQLTAVRAAMPNLFVSEPVANNQFRISGGKPGGEVYWTVIGIRNDRFVQRYGAKTERDKPADKRGTYVAPELYGQRPEMAEGYSGAAALPAGHSASNGSR